MLIVIFADIKGTKSTSNCCAKSTRHVFAIARRKLTQLLRNWRLFAFELLLPVFQVYLLLSAIGGDPHNLKIAVRTHSLFANGF